MWNSIPPFFPYACFIETERQFVVGIILYPLLLACSLWSKDTMMKYLGGNRSELNSSGVNFRDMFCFKHFL